MLLLVHSVVVVCNAVAVAVVVGECCLLLLAGVIACCGCLVIVGRGGKGGALYLKHHHRVYLREDPTQVFSLLFFVLFVHAVTVEGKTQQLLLERHVDQLSSSVPARSRSAGVGVFLWVVDRLASSVAVGVISCMLLSPSSHFNRSTGFDCSCSCNCR